MAAGAKKMKIKQRPQAETEFVVVGRRRDLVKEVSPAKINFQTT